MASTTGLKSDRQASSSNGQAPAASSDEEFQPIPDLVSYAKQYARQKPDVAAMWCFGIGFALGWKIKPW